MSTRHKPTASVMIGASTICKCLACREQFVLEGVTLSVKDKFDDAYQFERYNVEIRGPLGPIHPETEICGPPYRMSMYGILPSGVQFAFPCLTWSAVRDSNLWLSRPDSKGTHMAMLPGSGK